MSKGSRQRPVENPQQFENNWEQIFNKKKVTKMINKAHPKYEDLTEEQEESIDALHQVRNILEKTASVSPDLAKKLYRLWYENEMTLQILWGFIPDYTLIKYWNYPHCLCPKLDNDDAYPTGYYVVNQGCPVHGKAVT